MDEMAWREPVPSTAHAWAIRASVTIWVAWMGTMGALAAIASPGCSNPNAQRGLQPTPGSTSTGDAVPDATRADAVGPALPNPGPGVVTHAGDGSGPGPEPGPEPEPEPEPEPVPGSEPAPVIREYPRHPVAATFEVESTSALAWVYAPVATDARIDLEYLGPYRAGRDTRKGKRVATHYLSLGEDTGRTGVQALSDLEPDGSYRYRWQLGNGDATEWYHFRTAPSSDADAPVHFVFGADISNDPRYESPLITTMSASGAGFFLSLGDWPYTDLGVRDTTLDQYRASYRLARTHAQSRGLARAMSMYAIYDDHELHNDWDREFVEHRGKRARAALRAWDEFFPVRDDNPDPLVRKRYRSWRWGKHAQFFMLDTRRYRSPYKDPDGPDKTMLGSDQWDWLVRELRRSNASFKLIVTSVPMDYGTTREHWQAYRRERDALYDFLAKKRVRGVVFLTADQHWLSVHTLSSGHREYQVGPLRSFLRTPPEDVPEAVMVQLSEPNYGEIAITGGNKPRLVFTARDANGALLFADVIQPSLGHRPAPAAPESGSGKPAAGGKRR